MASHERLYDVLGGANGWILWGYCREWRGAFRILPLFGWFEHLQALCKQTLNEAASRAAIGYRQTGNEVDWMGMGEHVTCGP